MCVYMCGVYVCVWCVCGVYVYVSDKPWGNCTLSMAGGVEGCSRGDKTEDTNTSEVLGQLLTLLSYVMAHCSL